MKKTLLLLPMLFAYFCCNAQVFFSENFDNVGGPTAGGAGTYSFPSGWLLANVDNQIPAAAVSYINDAWERREDFKFNVTDSCAFSTSWYSPAGIADDWMWTPPISISGANINLLWNAVSYDPSYPDGYEVRIMTVSPTGSTGILGNMVSSSTVLFSVPNEASAWTSHTISLNAYAGQTVYIGFRNHSNDQFLLLIDDIVVQNNITYDGVTTAHGKHEFTQIPLLQCPSVPLSGNVKNAGPQPLTNIALKADIYNSVNAVVYSSSSSSLASLAAGDSTNFTIPAWVPSDTGTFTIIYYHTQNEIDDVPSNDTLTETFVITDTVIARDDGNLNGNLGIGAGNGGFLGQSFILSHTAKLSSVSMYMNSNYNQFKTGVAVWAYDNGSPTALLYQSPDSLFISFTPQWITFPIPNLNLPADTFVVTAVEVDSTMALGLTNDKFTPASTFVNWPTNPFAHWAHNEDFGASFAKTYMIRANLQSCNLSVNISGSSIFCAGSSTSLDAGSGYNSYLWSTGATTQSITVGVSGTFTVTVTDGNACTASASISTSLNPSGLSISCSGTSASCNGGTNGTAAVTIAPVVWSCNQFRTETQTGWDVAANGTNAGAYLVSHFNTVFPGGMVIGGGCVGAKTLTLTSVTAINDFLQNATGTPAALTTDLVDPTNVTYVNPLAGEIVALTLNVKFDNSNPNFAPNSSVTLSNMIYNQAPLAGLTVQQILNECNKKLGGCSSVYSAAQIRTAAQLINESWSGSVQGNSVLTCPAPGPIVYNYSYLWDDADSSTTASIIGLAAGTYCITVGDGTGCTTTCCYKVADPPPANVIITGATKICTGDSTLWDAGIHNSYLWSTGATTQTIYISVAGLYTVTVTDNGCTGSASATAVENPLPIPFITGDSTFCAGDSVELDAGAFAGYLWSTGSTTRYIGVSTGGLYIVTVTDNYGCTNSASYGVTANPKPFPFITFNAPGGTPLFENFESGILPPGWTATGLWHVTTACATGTPPDATHWAYYGQDGICTFNTGFTNSGILTSPTIAIPASATFAKVRFRYAYDGEGGAPPTGFDNASFSISVNGGTFAQVKSLSTTGLGGAWHAAEVSLNVAIGGTVVLQWSFDTHDAFDNDFLGLQIDSVAISYIGPPAFCSGSSILLDGGGGYSSYLWNTGATTRTISVNNASTFTVTVSNEFGCTNSASITTSIIPNPVPSIGGSRNFCTGDSTLWDAGVHDSYLWSTGQTTQSIFISTAGLYTVTVTDNSCTGSASATAVENPLPIPFITGDSTFCTGDSVELDAGAFSTYIWSTGSTTRYIGVSAGGTYTVTVTDVNGCTGKASYIVSEYPLPVPIISGNAVFCEGSSTILDAGSFAGYLWSTGATTQTITVSTAGTYYVIVTNIYGCKAPSVPVTVFSKPLPDVSQPSNQAVCHNTSTSPVNFSSSDPTTLFLWTNNNTSIGLGASGTGNISSFIATNDSTAPKTATVTVTPKSACSFNVTDVFTNDSALVIPTGPAVITSTIVVSGALPYLQDLNVVTNIAHTFCSDLDITIKSPSGRVVTLTTDNGGGLNDIFNGTTWDDDANPLGQVPYSNNNGLVTDQLYSSDGVIPSLVPEEPLGAFIGENPNGTWTITISDDGGGDGGSLNSWSLVMNELAAGPYLASTSVTQNSPVTIPTGPAVVTSAINVSGAGTILEDVNLTTFIAHSFAADLDMTIKSPAGTIVTLTTDNGDGNDNVYNGTVWDDNANPGGQVPYANNNGMVTDHIYSNGVLASPLTPEEALAAFIGEDPNGTWTLTISDDAVGDGGTLFSWKLDLKTATCFFCTGPPKTFTITVNPLPNPSISGSTSFCPGGSTTLDAGAWNSYQWSTGATTRTIVVNAAGIYDVTVTNAYGCTRMDSVAVSVGTNLSPSITGNLSFCSGKTTTLDAGIFTGYLWSTGETTRTIVVSTAGKFVVTVNNGIGCSGKDSVLTTITPLPTPSISGNRYFCPGDSTKWDAGIWSSYLWSTGATTQSIYIYTAGTFTVTVTNESGCTASTSATSVIYALPVVSFSGLATSYQLASPPAVLTGSPAGGIFSGPGIIGNTFNPVLAGIGGPYTITYLYTDTVTGCKNSASKQTTVINCVSPPKPGTITGATKVCSGDTKTYYIVAVPGALTYTWTVPYGATIISGQGTLTLTVKYNSSFTGGYIGVAACGCAGTSLAKTLLISKSTAATPSVITGPANGTCKLDALSYSVVNVAGTTYQWGLSTSYATIISGQGTHAVVVKFSSSFTSGQLTVKAITNCGTSASRSLTISAAPPKPGSITGAKSVCKYQQGVPYYISPVAGALNYTWVAPTGGHVKDGSITSSGNSLTTSSTSVKINFGYLTGNVQVRANNYCTSSVYVSLNVYVGCSREELSLIKNFDVICYPVPATNELNVIFNSDQETNNSIRITDIPGKTLLLQNNSSAIGENKYTLDVSTISSGIYMIEVMNGDQKSIQKIMIE